MDTHVHTLNCTCHLDYTDIVAVKLALRPYLDVDDYPDDTLVSIAHDVLRSLRALHQFDGN